MPKRKTWEEVHDAFNRRNLTLLSDESEYRNKSSYLTCMDNDGYLYYLTYDLVADKRTVQFSIVSKANKYSIKNIQHWIRLHNCDTILLSECYIDEKSPLLFRCECGEEYESYWNRMSNINKCRCNKCGEKARTSRHTKIDDIKREVESYGYILVDEDINNIKSIIIRDNDGNEYHANLFALRYGYIYSKYSKIQSMIELKTANYLDELKVKYIPQYTIDGCRNIYKLRFDFYLPEYNTIIEVHGEQHYKDSSDFFGFTLKEQQERDSYKRDFCIKHQYKYIEIPYTAYPIRKYNNEEYKSIINKILE